MEAAADRVLTTYFNSQPHPQYKTPIPGDCPEYIEPWYRSMRELGLHGVVFHDGLSRDFIDAWRTPEIDFAFVDPASFDWCLNDQRFFVYRRYLRRHPEIARVFMTDASDLEVVQDPFVRLHPERVYVGSEPAPLYPAWPEGRPGFGFYRYVSKKLDAAGGALRELLASAGDGRPRERMPVLNAGILGGDRNAVLPVLDKMTETFEAVGKPQENLNMGIFNYVLYEHFRDDVVTGFPVHSRFGKRERHRRDVWFIHK